MAGIYSIMDISRWSMQAATRALDTVSHNVSNANTEGYSRQDVVLATATPQYTGEGWYGNGVRVVTVTQQVDKHLQKELTNKNSQLSYYNDRLTLLQRLEALNNESSDNSLGQSINDFFDAWSNLSNSADSSAVRETVVQTAQNLCTRIQTLNQDLVQVSKDLDGYIGSGVTSINNLCRQIASLNTQIVSAEAGGDTANDLRDERQNAINSLSQSLNVQWFEDGSGQVSVFTGNGIPLVQADYPGKNDSDPLLYKDMDGYTGKQVVSSTSNQILNGDNVSGGEMGAWLSVRDGELSDAQSFLDNLTKTVISDVNLMHSQGAGTTAYTSVTGTYRSVDSQTSFNSPTNTLPFKDLISSGSFQVWSYQDGTAKSYTINVDPSDSITTLVNKINNVMNPTQDPTVNPVASVTSDNQLSISSSNGITFAFGSDTSGILAALGVNTFFDGYDASNITVSSNVVNDVSKIAAGKVSDSGQIDAGDNTNALDLADLKDSDTMNGSTQTFNESIISFFSDLGSAISNTQDNQSYAQASVTSLQSQRDEVSAVSLDDEMVKMIQYQRMYQTSAKLVSVADSLLSSLIDIVK